MEWIDGSSLNYGFNIDGSPTIGIYPWYQGEPNNGNEDCIHLFYSERWNIYPLIGMMLFVMI